VTDRYADYIGCQFEREFWVRSGDNGEPAFVLRHSPAGIMSYEFCGIVFAIDQSTESLYIRDRAL
jgi:hypothetical protein